MVLQANTITAAEQAVLNIFDTVGFVGVSTDTSNELSSSTVLTGEVFRKALDATLKDSVLMTYEFDGTIGLTEANGNTIDKIGFFTAISGSNLVLSKLLTAAIAKDSTKEINIGYQIAIGATDST